MKKVLGFEDLGGAGGGGARGAFGDGGVRFGVGRCLSFGSALAEACTHAPFRVEGLGIRIAEASLSLSQF